MRSIRGYIAAALAASCLSTGAEAQIRTPDCEALAAWAARYDRAAQWRPNQLGTSRWVPTLMLDASTEQLFGKPMLQWSEAEAGEVVQGMQACERQFQQARQFEKRNAIDTMRGWTRNNVTAYLRALAAARQAVPAHLAALEQAPASPQMLRFYAALANAGNTPQTFNAANQAAGQLQGDAQAQARGLLQALRDMPQAEIGQAVSATANARAASMRGAVRDQIVADVGQLPPNAQSLQWLAGAPQALRQQYGTSLGADDFRPIDAAVAARRSAIGTEAEKAIVAEIAAVPANAEAFARIDQMADERALRLLPPENLAKIRSAAAEQRKKAGEVVVADVRRKLGAMPQTQESLDLIDEDVLPGIAAMPASANEQKAQLTTLAQERRTAILAAVNRVERGSLRGRSYDSAAGFSLEFVDRTRVFLKMGDQTTAGTYTEESDGRVVVTVNNQSMVLTREGRNLTGGPALFKRTK